MKCLKCVKLNLFMAQCLMDYPPLQSHAPRMANSCSLSFLIFGFG